MRVLQFPAVWQDTSPAPSVPRAISVQCGSQSDFSLLYSLKEMCRCLFLLMISAFQLKNAVVIQKTLAILSEESVFPLTNFSHQTQMIAPAKQTLSTTPIVVANEKESVFNPLNTLIFLFYKDNFILLHFIKIGFIIPFCFNLDFTFNFFSLN